MFLDNKHRYWNFEGNKNQLKFYIYLFGIN